MMRVSEVAASGLAVETFDVRANVSTGGPIGGAVETFGGVVHIPPVSDQARGGNIPHGGAVETFRLLAPASKNPVRQIHSYRL